MSNDEHKRIKVEVCVPVAIELRVRWDPESEEANIGSVALAPIQSSISPDRLCEHLGDDDLQYIDEETKKAFGIEDE